MKILNSNEKDKIWIQIKSSCASLKNNTIGINIFRKKGRAAADSIIDMYGRADWESWKGTANFIHISHMDEQGVEVISEMFEFPEDFPDAPGQYFVCPKCGAIMIGIQ